METGATDATVGPHPYPPNRTHDQNLGARQPEATPAIPVKDPGRNLAISALRLAGRANIAHARRDLHDHNDAFAALGI